MQRPSPRFRSEEYFIYETLEEMFYPNFIEICIKTRTMLVTHLDELQHGGRKPTETSVTEFCCKRVNLLLEKS